ncbi:hypothetical protein DXC81_08200 [Collinsella tanakaei]|uniref:SF4 helicase domain-containing protein n=1 Tax=Collinsella tanakaei TaxID=626935 RepID=A0A3E4QRW3_9ACTN|nr:DnaB-like helicase C-terminal domain-containing protein [Collinsella tanakaei]RGL09564.1 hypothetical protein DXC81_08200 [Collinsella tanakaei]
MLANNRPATVPAAYRKPVSALLRDMGAVFNGADGRIPFRPDPLAHALRGGLGEEFVLIGATPAAGKTDLALNIALSVAANRKVVFMSLEIPATAVVRRALPCLSCSLDASVPATEHDFASIDGLPSDRAESCRSVVSHAATLLERVVVVDDRALDGPDDHSIEALANAIHAIALADGAPPVVVVDYVQLMGVSTPAFSVTDIVDRVSRGLAKIAHGERTPVVAIASLGKDGTFRSSSQLTFDPDIILRLKTERSRDDGSRDVVIEVNKFRDGRAPQEIPLRYWPAFHFFGTAD